MTCGLFFFKPCNIFCGDQLSAGALYKEDKGHGRLGPGPLCTVEEKAREEWCLAGKITGLLKGQQVWVKALIVKAGGPCLRSGATVLPGLGKADGAQAEFEAIPLNEARGGGSSVLSCL